LRFLGLKTLFLAHAIAKITEVHVLEPVTNRQLLHGMTKYRINIGILVSVQAELVELFAGFINDGTGRPFKWQ